MNYQVVPSDSFSYPQLTSLCRRGSRYRRRFAKNRRRTDLAVGDLRAGAGAEVPKAGRHVRLRDHLPRGPDFPDR